MVDFKALKEQHAKTAKDKEVHLFSIVLGVRGRGKSGTAAGTHGDKRVLQLVFSQEDHGIESAEGIAAKNAKILPVMVDVKDGVRMDPDNAYKALIGYLDPVAIAANFDVVVLDGLSALDVTIAGLKEVVKADGFSVGRAISAAYDQVLSKLKECSLAGLDVVITCSTEHRELAGQSFECPNLRGKAAADTIIGSCSEILHLAVIEKEREDGTTEDIVCFVFDTEIKKSGLKLNKEKYNLSLAPRVTGVPKAQLRIMRADMAALKAWKTKMIRGE